jgi:hypothetical protein
MREIFVTNNNDFHHEDCFDGVTFQFPPMERVAVPVEAAEHMFGFNKPDKTEALQRLGWASHYSEKHKRWEDDPTGPARLAKFAFTRAVMVEERIESVDAEPEKRPKGAIPFLSDVRDHDDALV